MKNFSIRISYTGNSSPSLPFSSCPHSMRASQRLKENGRVGHGHDERSG
jgi:hypothetical protein